MKDLRANIDRPQETQERRSVAMVRWSVMLPVSLSALAIVLPDLVVLVTDPFRDGSPPIAVESRWLGLSIACAAWSGIPLQSTVIYRHVRYAHRDVFLLAPRLCITCWCVSGLLVVVAADSFSGPGYERWLVLSAAAASGCTSLALVVTSTCRPLPDASIATSSSGHD